MTNYDDPRIAKLPAWARDLIDAGPVAHRKAAYWENQYTVAAAELDELKVEYARTNGAAEYDTWVTTETEDGEVAFGLGVGRTVEFGEDDCAHAGLFNVRYRDGGLDIDGMFADCTITPRLSAVSGRPALRIEAL